jgi:hypothetical protein
MHRRVDERAEIHSQNRVVDRQDLIETADFYPPDVKPLKIACASNNCYQNFGILNATTMSQMLMH